MPRRCSLVQDFLPLITKSAAIILHGQGPVAKKTTTSLVKVFLQLLASLLLLFINSAVVGTPPEGVFLRLDSTCRLDRSQGDSNDVGFQLPYIKDQLDSS